MSSSGFFVVIKWIKSIELKPRVLKVECEWRGQTIGTLSTRTGEDDDGFPEVKFLLGRALRMSQRLHHPVLPRIRREVECFAVLSGRDYLLGFMTLKPPSTCTP